MDLPDDLLTLLRLPSTCYLATTMPDGSPQLRQTWVDTDGSNILINTVEGFQKVRNVARDAWYSGRDQVRLIMTIAPDTVCGMG